MDRHFYGKDKEPSRADLEQVAVVEDEGTGKIGTGSSSLRKAQANPTTTSALDARCPFFHYGEWRIKE